MVTQCDLCGLTYVEENPDDEELHAARHAKFLEPISPKASLALKAQLEKDPDATWVDYRSPTWLREEVYWRAKVFQREFGYDLPQWEIKGHHDPSAIGFVFHDLDFRIVGACCFRPNSSQGKEIRLDWVWICPSMRRRGLVSSQWESFRRRFGVFLIEGPISKAMSNFLSRQFPDHKILNPLVHEPKIPMVRFSSLGPRNTI